MGKTRGTQAGPTPQWAPGPARAPLGGPTPPAARLPGSSRVSLELVLELLGNTTLFRFHSLLDHFNMVSGHEPHLSLRCLTLVAYDLVLLSACAAFGW